MSTNSYKFSSDALKASSNHSDKSRKIIDAVDAPSYHLVVSAKASKVTDAATASRYHLVASATASKATNAGKSSSNPVLHSSKATNDFIAKEHLELYAVHKWLDGFECPPMPVSYRNENYFDWATNSRHVAFIETMD